MNKKLARLLESGLRKYFLCPVLFALIMAYYSVPIAVGELVVVGVLFIYFHVNNSQRKKEVVKYLDRYTGNLDTAGKDATLHSPLPMVIFRPDTDEVVWSNDRFLQITGERDRLFDTKLSAAVPGFNTRWLMEGKHEYPGEVCIGEHRFLVFGHMVGGGKKKEKSVLATTYWVEVTEYSRTAEEYNNSRPVGAVLLLDNYDEITKNLEESARSAIRSAIDQRLKAWVDPVGGIFLRYNRDRYLFVFEERYLQKFKEEKFPILDSVREVLGANNVPATLSVGIGQDADSLEELMQNAMQSIEMALSRGGDQVVIKNRFNFEFFGGRSKELEKRTKVKSRVMANALKGLISDSTVVYVMGHKFPDLDAFGACVGVRALCRKLGVPCYIIKENGKTPSDDMIRAVTALPEYERAMISEQDALVAANSRSLLVVVDTNRPEQVQAPDLLAACKRVAVIDHHRRAATYIADAALNFHEPYASSASELVSELVQYLLEPKDFLRAEAEALMAGIMLDTKNFTMRTGGRTFEAAAFLRRAGADTGEVKKYFQNDLDGVIARYDIIQNARIYRDGLAIAAVDHAVGRVTAAQAADELLNIAGIDASIVLFEDGGTVYMSGRSMGETNVQVILEELGGGGNAATAGAQLAETSLEEALRRLKASIDKYFEDE